MGLFTSSDVPGHLKESIVNRIISIFNAFEDRSFAYIAIMKCISALSSNPSFMSEFVRSKFDIDIMKLVKRDSDNPSVIGIILMAMGQLSKHSSELRSEFRLDGGLELLMRSRHHSNSNVASTAANSLALLNIDTEHQKTGLIK